MRITIHGQGVDLDRSLKEHIRRRLQFAMSRFSTRVREVVVRLADINGDRGGADRSCRIMVHLSPTGTIMIEDCDVDHLVAIDRAADRAGRAVARELRRRWEVRRRATLRGNDEPFRLRGASRVFSHRN
ncbi:MAG TPA: HPF/RaiA family ribosome-associated protein [Phycisphaerae bacterium]|nr:HPF/RaiA family ribosome-associated protein [Phycisphaerae bacterium]HRY68918.1 HPF/RaiA family ribosome-associated protein [Phycisphaerae bacterium]HSA25745.1 HPF/RaiA family ribosome-associated protein [Phycisphaerae bacterium]